MVEKFEAMKARMASMRTAPSTPSIATSAATSPATKVATPPVKEKTSALSSFMKKTGLSSSKDKDEAKDKPSTVAPSSPAAKLLEKEPDPPRKAVTIMLNTDKTLPLNEPSSHAIDMTAVASPRRRGMKSSGMASPRGKAEAAKQAGKENDDATDQGDGEGLSKNMSQNSRSKSFNELQKMQLKVGEMRAQKRAAAPQKKPTADNDIQSLGFSVRKSSRAPGLDPSLGLVGSTPRRGSRLVKPGADEGTKLTGAALLEAMKAKTNERRLKKEERLKKKEENKQAVSNQTEVFMKALMNLETQFKQHESMRAVITKELETTKAENDVLRASLQAIQSHLTKIKGEVDGWVDADAVVSGNSLVSLQKVIVGLLNNPADMPMISLPKPTSTLSGESSSNRAEPSLASIPAPPPPPTPGALAPGAPPPPPLGKTRPASTQISSPVVSRTENHRNSGAFAGGAGGGSISFLDSIRSGKNLKKIDLDEVAKEKKQATLTSGLAQTLEETMKIAMELRKKAMEAQDSDEDEDDEDDEDDDDWYSDDE